MAKRKRNNKTTRIVSPGTVFSLAVLAVLAYYAKPDTLLPVVNTPVPFVRTASELELMVANPSNVEMYQVKTEDVEKQLPCVKFLEGPPMQERRERAMGARFRNFYRFPLTMWWDDGSKGGVFSGEIEAFGFSSTNTYSTHVFIFRHKETNEEIVRLTMNDDEHLMLIGPDPSDSEILSSELYQDTLKEQQFMKEYYAQNGIPWLSFYPRSEPVLYMYPAEFVGQVHKLRSNVGYYLDEERQESKGIDFQIKVVSTRPRVFLIENLLSPFEVQHIIDMGVKVVRRSSVGNANSGFKSDTRTSENGWLPRRSSKLLDTLYYRFADVLQMTDEQLVDGRNGSIENLQFVRYEQSQKYEPHHDFGNNGRPEQRFSTMLIYLKIPKVGGATSFPKAFNGQGIKVKPKVGDAVLFYSMLPDGNADDLSLHAGTPVVEGTKYICNLWSWDPIKI